MTQDPDFSSDDLSAANEDDLADDFESLSHLHRAAAERFAEDAL